jgi:hypothetical protein
MAESMMDSALQKEDFDEERLVIETLYLAGQLGEQCQCRLIFLSTEIGSRQTRFEALA